MAGHFLVTQSPGPGWIPGKPFYEQPLMDHGRWVHGLHLQGVLVEGGPFTDDGGGGFYIVEAEDLDAAAELAAQDPAVRDGIFTAEVRPWFRVDWNSYPTE